MATQLNTNIKVSAPAPIDKRYLSERTVGGSPLPYSATTEVIAIIPSSERYIGLTVNINNVDYWFKNGVADGNLILKTVTGGTVNIINAITGATNIGFFSGKTGIQTLNLSGAGFGSYIGNYYSEYNNYYRDSSGIVRLGTPTYHGALRRAYINSARTVSWLFDQGLNAWQLSSVDITSYIGNYVPIIGYTGSGFTNATWSGSTYNGSVLVTAYGSLNTGVTITVGNPVFNNIRYNELRFRTIKSKNPGVIKITNDDSFIYFSGSSLTRGQNLGIGIGIYTGVTGNTLQFRSILGTGGTTVTNNGGTILISSSSGGTTIGANIGIGTGIYSTKVGASLLFRSLKGSGNTTVIQSGSTVVIYSSGGTGSEKYTYGSPSVCTVGGLPAGSTLTGLTANQILAEILVPELCGTITAPSIGIGLTASGLYEIGCSLSQTVTGTFNRGCINPQYCSSSDKRSGCAISYCFTGCGMPSGFQSCASSPAIQTNPSYSVIISSQSWGVCTCYDAGSPALGSKGTQYCTALSAGCTSAANSSIVGVYPLFGTTSSITVLTKQSLVDMTTANNVQMNLVSDSSPNKQKFEIPCAWLSTPTNRPLVGVQQYNTVSAQWEYPGGSQGSSLALWNCSTSSETIQGNSIGYCRYTYNGVDRSAVCIRLVF